MKKWLLAVMMVGMAVLFGCNKPSPENVAKDYVKKVFNPEYHAKLDTSKLKYSVLEKKSNQATVKVSGNIYFEKDIELVKIGGKWKIKEEGKEMATPKPTPPHKPEAAQ